MLALSGARVARGSVRRHNVAIQAVIAQDSPIAPFPEAPSGGRSRLRRAPHFGQTVKLPDKRQEIPLPCSSLPPRATPRLAAGIISRQSHRRRSCIAASSENLNPCLRFCPR